MSVRYLIWVVSLTGLLSGCTWMQPASKAQAMPEAEAIVRVDDPPVHSTDAIVIAQPDAGQTTEEPKAMEPNPTPLPPPSEPGPPSPPAPAEIPCDGLKIVVATQQLGSKPFQAQIEFNGSMLETSFNPAPGSASLCVKGLTPSSGSLFTLRFLQNDQLRFIAKRANTVYAPGQTARLIIDDCLIHATPWDGRAHNGSCEWTISEVGPG